MMLTFIISCFISCIVFLILVGISEHTGTGIEDIQPLWKKRIVISLLTIPYVLYMLCASSWLTITECCEEIVEHWSEK